MAATLYQAIRVLSKGKYTVGPEGTISSEDAAILEELLADEINRRNPGFAGSDLIRFKAYHMLDAIVNFAGSGTIIDKTVKDTRWKVATPKASSQWMEYADKMIAGYRNGLMPTGVARCDSEMAGFDSSTIQQYGEPSDAL